MKKFLVTLLVLVMLTSSAFALEISEPGTLPLISGEDITLIIGIQENVLTTNYEENYLTQLIEERTGVKLDFMLFPTDAAEAKQKLSLMVAGGQKLPDILCLNLTDAERLNYGQGGYFLPMNDWLKNDAYFWNESMTKWASEEEKEDVIKYGTSPDGNLYAYPAYIIDPADATFQGLYINKVWLDNLGLEAPTTTDELYTVLKAFKEQDANGNGDPTDEIPLVGHINGFAGDVISYLMNSFDYHVFTAGAGWQLSVKDGQLYAPFAGEAYRQGLEFIHKLCAEGLISPLSFSQSQNELRAILSAPNDQDTLVGSFCGHPAPLFGSDGSVDRVNEYIPLPNMKGPEGISWSAFTGRFGRYRSFVTCDSEYPELAFRVLDAVAKEELSISMRYGEQGKNWEYKSEGEVRHKYLPGFEPVYTQLEVCWTTEDNIIWHDNAFNMMPPKLFAGLVADPWPTANYGYQLDGLCYAAVPMREGNQPEEIAPKLIFTTEELDQIAEIEATLRTYVEEASVNFALGNRDIANEWEAYLKELEDIGLQQYLEVAQNAYDRMNAAE